MVLGNKNWTDSQRVGAKSLQEHAKRPSENGSVGGLFVNKRLKKDSGHLLNRLILNLDGKASPRPPRWLSSSKLVFKQLLGMILPVLPMLEI